MPLRDALHPRFLFITYVASAIIFGSYLYSLLVAIWWHETSILLPVKMALVIGFAGAVGYPLLDFLNAIRKRSGKRLFISGIALFVSSSLFITFHRAISSFIFHFENEPLMDLTQLSYEIKMMTTIALMFTVAFFVFALILFLIYWLIVSVFGSHGK